ncbi:MAG: MaoC family dehydratase [Pseudomonadota bacterium]
MRRIHYNDLDAAIGERFGPSPWIAVDQAMIDAFAAATGDHQWIHVDRERAAREIGSTIAHGYLTLSLLPEMRDAILQFDGSARLINYGLDRLRFPAPVPAGARLRLTVTLSALRPARAGRIAVLDAEAEIEGGDRPALIASILTLIEPDPA